MRLYIGCVHRDWSNDNMSYKILRQSCTYWFWSLCSN